MTLSAAEVEDGMRRARREALVRAVVLTGVGVGMVAVGVVLEDRWAVGAWAVYLLVAPLWIAAVRRGRRMDAEALARGPDAARERYRIFAFMNSPPRGFVAWLAVGAGLAAIGVGNVARGDPALKSAGLFVLAAFFAADACHTRFVARPRLARDLAAMGGAPKPPPALEARIREVLAERGKIEAIKCWRDETGCDLAMAVAMVDSIERSES